ncbi:MAG: c-type cytochrome [Proteobacteria bacterium]|nr:c-type cytochrome [Pseudomonadota bacterium]
MNASPLQLNPTPRTLRHSMFTVALFICTAAALVLSGCGQFNPRSATGFRLPDGDAAAGKQAFVDLRCYTCHKIDGVTEKFEGTGAANILLGGETTRVRNYGELVTSIINPSHRIAPRYPRDPTALGGESLMEIAALNNVMTVQQLVDLVAFLQASYRVVPPDVTPYSYRYPY